MSTYTLDKSGRLYDSINNTYIPLVTNKNGSLVAALTDEISKTKEYRTEFEKQVGLKYDDALKNENIQKAVKTATSIYNSGIQQYNEFKATENGQKIISTIKMYNEKAKKFINYTVDETGQLYSSVDKTIARYHVDKDGTLRDLRNKIIPTVMSTGNDIVALSKDAYSKSPEYISQLEKTMGLKYDEIKKMDLQKASQTLQNKVSDISDKITNSKTYNEAGQKINEDVIDPLQKTAKGIRDFFNKRNVGEISKRFPLTNQITEFAKTKGIDLTTLPKDDYGKGLYYGKEILRTYERGYKNERSKQIASMLFDEKFSQLKDTTGLKVGYNLFQGKGISSVKENTRKPNISMNDLANNQTFTDQTMNETLNKQTAAVDNNTAAIHKNTDQSTQGLANLNTSMTHVSKNVKNMSTNITNINHNGGQQTSDPLHESVLTGEGLS